MEPTFLSALALRFFRNSSQVECRLQLGILPLEDLYLVETLLRQILPPVATLLLEGPSWWYSARSRESRCSTCSW